VSQSVLMRFISKLEHSQVQTEIQMIPTSGLLS